MKGNIIEATVPVKYNDKEHIICEQALFVQKKLVSLLINKYNSP